MNTSRPRTREHELPRRRVLQGGLATIGLLAVSACGATTQADSSAKSAAAQAVVATYFGILNAGMASPEGDFSKLETVYASDGTLTQSNPAGQTTVYQGMTDILGFYKAAFAKFKGYQWAQVTVRSLADDVVLSYERAGSPPLSVPGTCSHLFVVQAGKIKSLDWVTYFGGK